MTSIPFKFTTNKAWTQHLCCQDNNIIEVNNLNKITGRTFPFRPEEADLQDSKSLSQNKNIFCFFLEPYRTLLYYRVKMYVLSSLFEVWLWLFVLNLTLRVEFEGWSLSKKYSFISIGPLLRIKHSTQSKWILRIRTKILCHKSMLNMTWKIELAG